MNLSFTAEQIAAMLGGTVVGDKQCAVNDVSSIEDGREGTLSFLCDEKYVRYLPDTKAGIVLMHRWCKSFRRILLQRNKV